jgi:multicomponent Na+:H+ antiporter subunit D
MDLTSAMPLLLLATSLVPAIAIFALREERHRARTAWNLAGAIAKVVLVVVLLMGVSQGRTYEWRASFLPEFDLLLRVDPVSLLFVSLSAVLWLFTTIYAIGYLEGSPNRSRFFGFFSLCVAATVGIALAGNLITFIVFYELLTIATYPLVVHRGTKDALGAGSRYLVYTVGGGAVLLLGIVWLHVLAGPVEFTAGGALAEVAATRRTELTWIFALLVGGLAVKAALVPLHGWLPIAMVAPAPVSALLHAVAVVKAGVYGIMRVVYDLYGLELASSLQVLTPLAAVAAITIVYGSIRALTQDELKKRLAYSTVSQVAYITLGTAIVGQLSAIGAFAHLIHQGIMKVTLFYCAGNVAEALGIHHVHEMRGVGRRMPVTMAAFTVAALGMMGVPPTAGFVSKWFLGLGGLEAGEPWVVVVLLSSSLLNAAYFLPIVYRAWFQEPDRAWPDHSVRELAGGPLRGRLRLEAPASLLAPAALTGLATVGAGILAASDLSPLTWARQVAEGLFP